LSYVIMLEHTQQTQLRMFADVGVEKSLNTIPLLLTSVHVTSI